LEVCVVVPGVTDAALKWHTPLVGKPPQERLTAWPKLEFTDDTVTVIADVVEPLATVALEGETATEKSAGAGPTLARNPSDVPPP
jgi:hypothetical protein